MIVIFTFIIHIKHICMISCDIKVNVYATAKSYMTFNIYTLLKLDPTSCLPMTFKHILLDIFLCAFYYSVCSCLEIGFLPTCL